jgi:hypothetical protein
MGNPLCGCARNQHELTLKTADLCHIIMRRMAAALNALSMNNLGRNLW